MYDIQCTVCNARHVLYDIQRITCMHTMYDIKCTTHGVRHTMYDTRCKTYNVRHTVQGIQCTTHGAQHRMYDTRCTTYNVRHTVQGIQCTTHGIRHIMYDTQCKINNMRYSMYDIQLRYTCMYEAYYLMNGQDIHYTSYNLMYVVFYIVCIRTYNIRRVLTKPSPAPETALVLIDAYIVRRTIYDIQCMTYNCDIRLRHTIHDVQCTSNTYIDTVCRRICYVETTCPSI